MKRGFLRAWVVLPVLFTGMTFLSCVAYAEDVVAVLSSHLEPYQEALSGFEEAFGGPVSSFDLSNSHTGITKTTKVIVAFGSRASAQSYPNDVKLVYCMAPGARFSPKERPGRTVRISMTPPASVILKKMKILQPHLKRLGFLWVSDNQTEFDQEMQLAAQSAGITLISRRMSNTDELPDQLRALQAAEAQALWVPPDPQLLTPQNFNVIRDFSRSSRIPFYVANEGFVEKGATAAVAATFEEIGRSAAKIARGIVDGSFQNNQAYPDKVILVVSNQAASETGLTLTPTIRRKVDRVIP